MRTIHVSTNCISHHHTRIILKSIKLRNIYKFLSSIDFSMIMVWWFDSGMIVWLWCDGSEVVFVNVNAYKSKKLQRNVKQKID